MRFLQASYPKITRDCKILINTNQYYLIQTLPQKPGFASNYHTLLLITNPCRKKWRGSWAPLYFFW